MQKYSTPAIVPGGGRDALSIETLPDTQFGSVDVYLASDVHSLLGRLLEHEKHGLVEFANNGSAAALLAQIKSLMVRGSHD